jgi:hypothetical protein
MNIIHDACGFQGTSTTLRTIDPRKTMPTTYRPARRKLVGLLFVAALIAGFAAVTPATGAQALGCSLGPSISAVAAEAGIGCPGSIGGSDAEHGGGGPSDSACKYNFNPSVLPDGLMDWVDRSGRRYQLGTTEDDAGYKYYRSMTVDASGRVTASVVVVTRPDHTYMFAVNAYGRYGLRSEFAYFDCRIDDAGYEKDTRPLTAPATMPATSATPAPSDVVGTIQTRGVLTPADGGNYLMRVDVTNKGTTAKSVELQYSLPGYTVDSFPVLSSQMTCAPMDGLHCSLDYIAPGSTVMTWILLTPGGTGDPSVNVAVTNIAGVKFALGVSSGIKTYQTDVTNFYTLNRS